MGLRRPEAQAGHRHLQLAGAAQAGDLHLSAVVHNVQLHHPGGLPAAAAVVDLDLVPGEHPPDAGNGGDLVAQDPLPANGHPVEPLSVGLDVPVHHGEQLLHRRGLVGVGQLGADGPGQPAFGGTEGVPQVGVGLIEEAAGEQQERAAADNPDGPVRKFRFLLSKAHEKDHTAAGCQEQIQHRPQQPGQPLPGPVQTVAPLGHRVRVALLLPPQEQRRQQEAEYADKMPRGRHKYAADHPVPRPFQMKSAFVPLVHSSHTPFASLRRARAGNPRPGTAGFQL